MRDVAQDAYNATIGQIGQARKTLHTGGNHFGGFLKNISKMLNQVKNGVYI